MSKKPVLFGGVLVVALVVLAMVAILASGPSQPQATVATTPVMTATPFITAPTQAPASTPTASATSVAFSLKLVEDAAKIAEFRKRFTPPNAGSNPPDLSGGFFVVEILGYNLRSLPGGSGTYKQYLSPNPDREGYGVGHDANSAQQYFFILVPGGTAVGTRTLEFAPPGQTPAKVTFEIKAK